MIAMNVNKGSVLDTAYSRFRMYFALKYTESKLSTVGLGGREWQTSISDSDVLLSRIRSGALGRGSTGKLMLFSASGWRISWMSRI